MATAKGTLEFEIPATVRVRCSTELLPLGYDAELVMHVEEVELVLGDSEE